MDLNITEQEEKSATQQCFWTEYEILNHNFVSTKAWGKFVVSIFAVFTTAMIASVGFIASQWTILKKIDVKIFAYLSNLGDTFLLLTAIIGFSSVVWGAAMVVGHAWQTRVMLNRMKQLEKLFYSNEDPSSRFAHQQIFYEDESRAGKFAKLSTVFILLIITLIWIGLIFKSLWLQF